MTHPAHQVIAAAALALTSPAPAPQPTTAPAPHNILRWSPPATLSPPARALVAAIGNAPTPDPWPPLAAQRKFTDDLQASFGATLQKRYGVRVERATIAGVPVRVIYPKGASTLGTGPVLLNLHGGGFTLDSGSLTETIPIAALTNMPVVAVLYRLAPEAPFPAAVDDALAVYRALATTHGARHIAVFGTSAGASLGAELIARLARAHAPMPAALGLLSGSADVSKAGDSESWMPLPEGAHTAAELSADYIGKTPLTDPILSPLKGPIAGFPPTLLLSSTRDFLLSSTSIFARALTEQGVDARLVVFDGLPHAFWAYMDVPESDEAHRLVARFLKDRLLPTRRSTAGR